MFRRVFNLVLAVVCIHLATMRIDCPVTLAVEPAEQVIAQVNVDEDWLRIGEGTLKLRVQGEIMLPSGDAANQPAVSAILVKRNASEELPVQVDGHEFTLWVPAHQRDWYALQISATSADNRLRVSKQIVRINLRQLAIDGLKLPLEHHTRTVKVDVVHDSRPVPNAKVKMELKSSTVLRGVTNRKGDVQFELLPNEVIESFTAWTDDHRFGGFQFSRGPVRDPKANEHTVELASCRKQMIRIVDAEGTPQPNVRFHLHVATPNPHINFLGQMNASNMVTNDSGEATFDWFPAWEKVHCYIDLESDQWVIDGKNEWMDGDLVIRVKPKRERRLASGILKRKQGSVAGFLVQWRSFQGERERLSDHIQSVTDTEGRFSADVLPDSTYCVFVNDRRFISEMVDLIPCPTDGDDEPHLTLNLTEGTPVSVRFTAGETERPLGNETLNLRQEHDVQWIEKGETRRGSSARDCWAITDENGSATVYVIPNKELTVSVYNPDWRGSETINVTEKGPNRVELNREFDKPRPIVGIVLQDEKTPVELGKVHIVVGSIDGQTIQEKTLTPREDGVFSFESQAVAVGVLATSEDLRFAGVLAVRSPRRLLRVQLKPTVTVRGQLLDSKSNPIAGRIVRGSVRLHDPVKDAGLNRMANFMSAKRLETTTDENGEYVFEHIPRGTEFAMSTPSLTENQSHWLGSVNVKEQNVERKPRTIEE